MHTNIRDGRDSDDIIQYPELPLYPVFMYFILYINIAQHINCIIN